MLKKTFVLTQFGSPHPWTQQYIDHVQHLGQYGWNWIIFTPNDFVTKGNVQIVKMGISEFNELVKKNCGVDPKNKMVNGLPEKPMSDYYVAAGQIFKDYLKDSDFWGITNWDIVYGRIDRYMPDSVLEMCDVFSDDLNAINGIFSLFRNRHDINNLFREIPDWETKFCSTAIEGTDEYGMTDAMKKIAKEGRAVYVYPQYYPYHSHDRLEQHVPDVKLQITDDGSLFELFRDTNPPIWIHARPIMGKQIAYFHFIRTKKWPSIAY